MLLRGRKSKGDAGLPPKPDESYEDLSDDSGRSVENDVLPASGPRSKQALMPLIEAGYQQRAQYRDVGPAECPSLVGRSGQGFSPGAEEQDAEEAVAKHVSGLADQVVPGLEAGVIHSKEKMEQRVENLAGVVGRQVGAGFDGDDDQPQDGGDPRLHNFFLAARQECRDPRRWLFERTLFDRIVWSFASDHDVVHVRLAQSGAADSYKARLL